MALHDINSLQISNSVETSVMTKRDGDGASDKGAETVNASTPSAANAVSSSSDEAGKAEQRLTARIKDIANFLTGDPTITDYKLKYISYLAGYRGEDLKGKVWSFSPDADHQIYIYPETLERAFDAKGDFTLKNSYGNLDTILKRMPKVEIRSFQQRTLLQMLVDGVATLVDECAGNLSEIFSGSIIEKTKKMFQNVCDNIKEKWKESGESPDSLFGSIIKGITPDGLNEDHVALLNLPFIFYYCLASATTRCYFTVPLNVNSYNNLWASNSRQGWAKGDVMSTANALKSNLESIKGFGDLGIGPLIGVALGSMFGASFAPRFYPGGVNMKAEGEFDLNFTLYNDTAEHARANLGFIRVLIPSAMWSNVGFFAISGDLYDIKIKGGMRWLMCTGTFSIKPRGALRKMGKDNMRVPDAYEVSCQFKSLLPNNLNNYLLGYFTDFEISDRSSALGQIIKNVKEMFLESGGGGGAGGGSASSGSAPSASSSPPEPEKTPEEKLTDVMAENGGSLGITALGGNKILNGETPGEIGENG